jgi:hypothetical protein
VDWLFCKNALLLGWLCGVQWFESTAMYQCRGRKKKSAVLGCNAGEQVCTTCIKLHGSGCWSDTVWEHKCTAKACCEQSQCESWEAQDPYSSYSFAP